MHTVQQLLPGNYKPVHPELPRGFADFAATLKGVDRDWIRVPDTELSIRLAIMTNGASIEIKKNRKLALINLCCFEKRYEPGLLKMVEYLYKHNQLGTAKKPQLPYWVHTVPVKDNFLDEKELTLSYWLVITFYWAIYGQHLQRMKARKR